MKDFNIFNQNIFTMVEGNFGISMVRMKDFNIVQNIFAMVEENFGISMVANAPEWRISINFIKIFSPLVEENLGISMVSNGNAAEWKI